jgi:hypothetical protein
MRLRILEKIHSINDRIQIKLRHNEQRKSTNNCKGITTDEESLIGKLIDDATIKLEINGEQAAECG